MATPEREKALDRVRKILRLRDGAGTPEEAAAAAGRAQEILLKLQLTEGDIDLGGDETEEALPPPREMWLDPGHRPGKKVYWRGYLAGGIADANSCTYYWHGPRPIIIGQEDDIRTVRYLYQALSREVVKLADRTWLAADNLLGQSPRAWKNAFRLGCAVAIAARLRQTRTEVVKAAPNTRALVRLDDRAALTKAAYDDHDFRTTARPSLSSGAGYRAGKHAGRNVNIGGGPRLNKAQGRLET